MLGRQVKNNDYNFINEGTEVQKLKRPEGRPTARNGRVPGDCWCSPWSKGVSV